MSNEHLSLKQLVRAFKKISLRDGDILVVNRQTIDEDAVRELAAGIQALGMQKNLVVFADSLDDVVKLNDAEMARLGWLRTGVAMRLKKLHHVRPEGKPDERRYDDRPL